MLAYYANPYASRNDIREYTKEELLKPEKVMELFDYCQILEAYITEEGWDFLIQNYGYAGLYAMDQKSGWLSEKSDENTLEEYVKWVKYEMGKEAKND